MSPKERIGMLEALLARIRANASAPRIASPPVAITVPPTAEARAALRSESTEMEAVVPPPTPPAELESRARLVTAPAEGEVDVDVDVDVEEVVELDESNVVREAPPEPKHEEPPPSSRRPIAEPAETPQEAELEVASAAPHTPPPESGKQVASEGLSFDDDFTGVRQSGARLQPAAPVEPSIPLAPQRGPVPTPPPHALEAELPRPQPATVFRPEPEVGRGDETRPPPAPLPARTAGPMPEITRPTTPAAASQVASLVGAAATFSPKTFGELLDASLAL